MNRPGHGADTSPASETGQEQQDLPAGAFSSWLRQVRSALRGDGGMDVACGDCVGCCSASYFIHIKPQEKGSLERIPKELLFPAPGLPKGHRLMGYDRNGLCPMLKDGRCTIYAHRPQTCRDYDCRVFTAAGLEAGGVDKAIVNQRVNRWKFSYPTGQDREAHLAVQAAATFIRAHAACFPGGRVPTDPSQLAILAIKVYEVFMEKDGAAGARGDAPSDTHIAAAIVDASRQFDAAMLTGRSDDR